MSSFKDTITKAATKAADIVTPIPLPTKENRRKVKKGLRKFDNFMQEKFPNATKKLVEFDDKMKAKSDKFNEKADVYMEKNFPKAKKFIEKVHKNVERTFNSTGGRIGLKDGSKGCGKAKAGKGRAYGKNS